MKRESAPRRVLITGAHGQLGSALMEIAAPNWQVLAVDRDDVDMTDFAAIEAIVREHTPHTIVNCAAYTDVDRAETDEASCWTVNALAPGVLARAAAAIGCRVIQISTDYVFDGTAATAYPEDAQVNGLGVYGRSKAAGEQAVLAGAPETATILRTAWLYGPMGRNFVATILRVAESGEPLRVVDDQIGQPTYAYDVAERIRDVVEFDVRPGIYHATNSGQTSWFGFAQEILRLWGYENPVEPVASEAFSRPAPRPSYGVLGHARWHDVGLPAMRDWREALRAAHRDFAESFMAQQH